MTQRGAHESGGVVATARPNAQPSTNPPQQSRPLDPVASQCLEQGKQVIAAALSGRQSVFPLVEPLSLDTKIWTDAQRDAVARAVAAPELLVIEGPPGTGKTRVAMEAARRLPGPVLFVTFTPSTVLDAFAAQDVVAVELGVPDSESSGSVSQSRTTAVISRLLAESRDQLNQAIEARDEAQRLVDRCDQLSALLNRRTANATERADLASQLASVSQQVRQEAESCEGQGPYFVQRYRGVVTTLAKRLAAIDAESQADAQARAVAEEKLHAAEEVINQLRPKQSALDSGKWYSINYWKAKGDTQLPAKLVEAEASGREIHAQLESLKARELTRNEERARVIEEADVEKARYLDGEVNRRSSELVTRMSELERADELDAGAELTLRGEIGVDVVTANSNLQKAISAVEQARDKVEEVESGKAIVDLPPVQVFAVHPRDVMFSLGTAGVESFSICIVDDAHRVNDPDLQIALGMSARGILLGCQTSGRREKRAESFHRLASAFRFHRWIVDSGRLICRLHSLRHSDRKRLECEPLADAPDIELRFLPGSEDGPILAEIAFPDRLSPAQAREYLAREMDQITCDVERASPEWDGLTLRFAPPHAESTEALLADGVREELHGLLTTAIRFDSANWDLESARSWIAERFPTVPGGRLVHLGRPLRACPGLAKWLNEAFDFAYEIDPVNDAEAHVEFLAIPDHPPRRRDHRVSRPGGAGFEIDLSDPRQRAYLPPDLLDLPDTGLVNITEAEGLVRFLEHAVNPVEVVATPFDVQATVLRRMFAKNARVAHVRIVGPGDVVPECDSMAISLVRSHVSRAVTFGESPEVLSRFLTSVRRRVLFVGDPGTLGRRLQWEGACDHLSSAEAAREHAWVAALANCPRVSAHPRGRSSDSGKAPGSKS